MAKTLIIILTLVWPEVASSIPGGGRRFNSRRWLILISIYRSWFPVIMRSFFFLKMHDFLMVIEKNFFLTKIAWILLKEIDF